uniref:ATP synthase F0 subunit 8 n=1 Tax=Stenothyra glabra TaxID=1345646 RepID=UPI0026E4888A|nr:ATP synthase F0 subunit 8 [Stenothyra glabra]USN91680.1 ATP synthase F0 subunit 8 [Stenothyra glabra]
MPQLSPLNWIFLFVLFWASVILMSMLIWWSKKIYFPTITIPVKKYVKGGNKWSW